MALPALKETFDQITIMPPSFKLAEALSAISDAKDFEKSVSQGEADIRRWRASSFAKLREGLDVVSKAIVGQPRGEMAAVILPLVDGVLSALDEQIDATSTPLHETPRHREVMAKVRLVGGAAGRFLRKQVNRIEDIRVFQHNALIDMRYALLAFRSEFDPDAKSGETFGTAAELANFLRSQVA